jgi:glucose/arabinose dehydrogenase
VQGSDWKDPAMFSARLASLFVLVVGLVVVPGAGAQGHAGGRHTGGPPTATLRLVADGLTSPVTVVPANDGSRRLFVVDQAGTIRILRPNGTLAPEPFLDLRDRLVELMPDFDERGVLGLAFHPRYAKNGRLFVYYSAPLRSGGPDGFNVTSRISEFRVSATDPDRVDPASERVVLEVDKPQFNHNGGTILFGPRDGFLYISMGDGGGANDVGLGHVDDWFADNAGGNGQDTTQNLMGDILRIDVDRGRTASRPYGIPRDNPFVGEDGLDEIYAYGFRNPYRMSFDMGGRRSLLVGDEGQNGFEEVDLVTRGGNFGWNVKEGTHCFDAENPRVPPAACPATDPEGDPLIDPVIEYPNAARADGLGVAVIGGHVYRGRDLPRLRGRYVFGDFSRSLDQADGSLFVATPRSRGLWDRQELRVRNTADGRVGHFVLGFGQDLRGEIYVLTTDNAGPTGTTGKVFRLS